MSVKGALNISAGLLMFISVGISVIGFFFVNFYQDAQAQWKTGNEFRSTTQAEMQVLKFEVRTKYENTSKDISDINKKLDQILEVKLKRPPPR